MLEEEVEGGANVNVSRWTSVQGVGFVARGQTLSSSHNMHTHMHTHAHGTHVGLDESDGAEDTVGRARLAEASEIRHLDNHVVVEANVTARSGSVVLVHKYNGPGGQFQEERNQHMRVQPCAQPKERQHRVEVGL